MVTPSEIALIGERDPAKRAHVGIEASLALFQRDVNPALTFRWVPTASISAATVNTVLGSATGIWCVPGSPYENTAGALLAIRYAREQRRPFLGTCGGFQHALMEFSQNVLDRPAMHQEMDPTAIDPLIVQLTCSLIGAHAKIIAPSGSWYANTLGAADSMEEFNCNYGLAPTFVPAFAGSALEFVAHDGAGQARVFRLSTHPFFVGTLFQPERRAFTGQLHPLVRAFLRHAYRPAFSLHPYHRSDAEVLAQVYREAARAIGRQAYDPDQVRVWALYPDDIEEFRDRLARGYTLVAQAENTVVAFGQLDPTDHVAFIYCASAYARRGIASAIYARLETQAITHGVRTLTTDASRISRPFFEKKGFKVNKIEHSLRLGVQFERFRMSKRLGVT